MSGGARMESVTPHVVLCSVLRYNTGQTAKLKIVVKDTFGYIVNSLAHEKIVSGRSSNGTRGQALF